MFKIPIYNCPTHPVNNHPLILWFQVALGIKIIKEVQFDEEENYGYAIVTGFVRS